MRVVIAKPLHTFAQLELATYFSPLPLASIFGHRFGFPSYRRSGRVAGSHGYRYPVNRDCCSRDCAGPVACRRDGPGNATVPSRGDNREGEAGDVLGGPGSAHPAKK